MTFVQIMAIVAFVSGGVWLAARADRKATRRRAERLRNRDANTFDEWRASLPGIPPGDLDQVLRLIATVLGVPAHNLRPCDSFGHELALADQFFCLVVDDDTCELICDAVEEQFGIRPSGDWKVLRSVVAEVWPLTIANPPEENTMGVRA